jgi:hypothetical protein
MTEPARYQRGDIVRHPARPEWGQGVVEQAALAKVNGQAGQRLVIRFSNHGRATINTAVVNLTRKDEPTDMTSTTTINKGWLDSLEGRDAAAALTQLPEALTDPFASLAQRLGATLGTYRFSTDARPLIDWAVAQTGMADPLSHYSRHDLEQAFARFARDRDLHLADLVRQIKAKQKRDVLDAALADAPNTDAKAALQKAIRA